MMYASWLLRILLFVVMKQWELACEALSMALILCRSFEPSKFGRGIEEEGVCC